MARLLVVEDQPIQLESVCRGLEMEGFDVAGVMTGADCQRLSESQPPDAIILDLMLPDGDGLQVLSWLRDRGYSKPVLILSARDQVDQRISGLVIGADDYLVKPFSFSELIARIRALLRRNAGSRSSVMNIDDLTVDLVLRKATRGKQVLDLTPRQFDLLVYFLKHRGETISRERMAQEVWQAETATWTNVIEVQINRLRNKLEGPGQKPLLHTIRGKGYLLGDLPC